jgi:hypothetical protein
MNRMVTSATVVLIVCLCAAVMHAAQNPLSTAASAQPTYESCADLHDAYLHRFESAPGFGLSRMAQPPMLDRTGVVALGRKSYAIDTIELIGLLKLETPVAYVPRWHGAKPDGFSSRGLTAFEKQSLDEFRAGRNGASADEGKDVVFCMGSLRAKDSCVSCHRDKKIGDLLGAFTYRLRVLPKA